MRTSPVGSPPVVTLPVAPTAVGAHQGPSAGGDPRWVLEYSADEAGSAAQGFTLAVQFGADDSSKSFGERAKNFRLGSSAG